MYVGNSTKRLYILKYINVSMFSVSDCVQLHRHTISLHLKHLSMGGRGPGGVLCYKL